MYIGPFGARVGNAEMTLEAVVTFGHEDEDDLEEEVDFNDDDDDNDGNSDDEDVDANELPRIC